MSRKLSIPYLEDKIDALSDDITNIQCFYITTLVLTVFFMCLQLLVQKISLSLIIMDVIFLIGLVASRRTIRKINKELETAKEEYESLNKKNELIDSLYDLNNFTKNRIKVLGSLYIYLKDNFENKCNERDYSYFYLDDYFFSKVKSYLKLIEIMQKGWPKNEDVDDDLVDKIAEIEAEIEILANKYYDSIVNLNRKECELAVDMVHKTVNAPETELKALVIERKKLALPSSKEEEKNKESIHQAMTNDTLTVTREFMNGISLYDGRYFINEQGLVCKL